MKLRKKRQKIDFRGFFICHLRYCDVLITFSFFWAKSPQIRMESKHTLTTRFNFCVSFYVPFFFCDFLDCRNSFHLDFVKVR